MANAVVMLDFGPGLLKRIDANATGIAVGTPEAITQLLAPAARRIVDLGCGQHFGISADQARQSLPGRFDRWRSPIGRGEDIVFGAQMPQDKMHIAADCEIFRRHRARSAMDRHCVDNCREGRAQCAGIHQFA